MAGGAGVSKKQRLPATLRWRLRQMAILAHRLVPFVPHPDEREALTYAQLRDTEENEKSRPPADAEVVLQCAWAVEFYTPSDIPALRIAIQKLGWNRGEFRSDTDVFESVEQSRGHFGSGGWHNLGYIERLGSSRSYLSSRVGPLPACADVASARLCHVTPSITALVVCFYLKDEVAAKPLEILRTDRVSKFRALPRGHTVLTPEFQKREAISEFRREMRTEIAAWFQDCLPGLFSRGDGRRLPICEFLLTNLDADSETCKQLETVPEAYAWNSVNWPGVRFFWRLLWEKRETCHGALVADIRRLSALDVGPYGGGRTVYPRVFETKFKSFMILWGLLSGIREMRARISTARDKGLTPRNASVALRQLEAMTLESVDIGSVCHDLTTDRMRFLDWTDIADFSNAHRKKGKPIQLLKEISLTIKSEAQDLLHLDESLKALAVQRGTLLATAHNLILQKWVGWVAIAALLFGAVAAVEPGEKLFKRAAGYFSRVTSNSNERH